MNKCEARLMCEEEKEKVAGKRELSKICLFHERTLSFRNAVGRLGLEN